MPLAHNPYVETVVRNSVLTSFYALSRKVNWSKADVRWTHRLLFSAKYPIGNEYERVPAAVLDYTGICFGFASSESYTMFLVAHRKQEGETWAGLRHTAKANAAPVEARCDNRAYE